MIRRSDNLCTVQMTLVDGRSGIHTVSMGLVEDVAGTSVEAQAAFISEGVARFVEMVLSLPASPAAP